MEKIYVVTGASGFLGSTVCSQLLEKGCHVRTVARKKSTLGNIPKGVQIYPGNIMDPESLDAVFKTGSENETEFIVIHCAAKISVLKHDEEAYVINVEGTKNMLRAAKEHHAKRFIYVGSVDALYNPKDGSVIYEPDEFYLENPDSDYALSKCEASRIVMEEVKKGMDGLVVMPSAILGPGDDKGGFISLMYKMYIKGIPPFSIKGGYDFVDVRDVASAIIKASEIAPAGSVYTLSGHFMSVTDMFDFMAKCLRRKKTIYTFPTKIILPFAPIVNAIMKSKGMDPLLTNNSLSLLASEAVFSHTKADKELGYRPRPIYNTIIDTIKYTMKKEGMRK